MGANPIIYCLENLTDYLEFERLATDLMSLVGYSGIEPLGGFKDKGRDAIYVHNSGKVSIFAYSVRENWRVKLAQDATKIFENGHECNELVFVTTSDFSPSERDEAISSIKKDFGWDLQLYGKERLRVMIEDDHPELITRYPSIFHRDLIPHHTITTNRKYLFISYDDHDWGLAEWLSRKLTSKGYFVWCERLKLLGGEKYPDNIDDALNNETFRVIALYSRASLQNQEVTRQRYLAFELGKKMGIDFLIPLSVEGMNSSDLDRYISTLVFIPFDRNWGIGLEQLILKLESVNCPKGIIDGAIAVNANFGDDIIEKKSEDLFLNYFPLLQTPKYICVYESGERIPWSVLDEIKSEWAYKMIGSRYFLAFQKPDFELSNRYKIRVIDSIEWQKEETIQGKYFKNDLLSELLRKRLIVKCHQLGLIHCSETRLDYFPIDLVEGNWLKVEKPDGTITRVLSNGKRTFPYPKEEYRYSLAPAFHVINNVLDSFLIQIDVRVRISDLDSKALPRKKRQSRRKHLCHDWWNDEWFTRMLAISQFLADEENIVMRESNEEKFVVSASPYCLQSPISINEKAYASLNQEKKYFKALFAESTVAEEEEFGIYYEDDNE